MTCMQELFLITSVALISRGFMVLEIYGPILKKIHNLDLYPLRNSLVNVCDNMLVGKDVTAEEHNSLHLVLKGGLLYLRSNSSDLLTKVYFRFSSPGINEFTFMCKPKINLP